MADDQQIIAPPPGFTLREAPQVQEPLPAGESALPPGFTIRGARPLTQGVEELQRRQDVATELQKATENLPDPEEGQAGIRNTYVYSRVLDIPLSEAYQLRGEIAKEVTGDESTAQKSFWEKLTGAVKKGAKSGHAGLRAGLIQEKMYEEAFLLSLDALDGKWNQERYNKIMDMQQQIHALAPSEDTAFLNQVIWDVGQILPGMLGGMREGAVYGLGTAAVAGLTGTVVPGVGTATAAGGGFLFGFGAGMASHSFRQMRGQSWLALSQMRDTDGEPIPQSIVQLVSFGAGALNAAIEVGQMGTLIKTVPGIRKAMTKSVGNAFDKIVRDGTLRSKILQRIGEYGKYWSIEVGEELLQEIVDIVSEHVSMDLATALSKAAQEPDMKLGTWGTWVTRQTEERQVQFEHSTVVEDYQRLADTFIHSGPAMAILGLPGNVIGGAQDIAAWQQQQEQQVEARAGLSPEDQDLLRTVSEGLRVETPTTEVAEPTPLAQRLARASEARMIQAPINERLEIAKEVEDTAEKERVLSGDIRLQEVLEEQPAEVTEEAPTARELSAEESFREDARRFETAPEFLEYVYSALLTPEDVAEIGDKTILDMRLREYWSSVQEPEAEITVGEKAPPREQEIRNLMQPFSKEQIAALDSTFSEMAQLPVTGLGLNKAEMQSLRSLGPSYVSKAKLETAIEHGGYGGGETILERQRRALGYLKSQVEKNPARWNAILARHELQVAQKLGQVTPEDFEAYQLAETVANAYTKHKKNVDKAAAAVLEEIGITTEAEEAPIRVTDKEGLVRELRLEGLQLQEIEEILGGRKRILDVAQKVLQRTGVDIVPGETLKQQAKRRGLPIEEVESHRDAVSAAVDEACDRIGEIIGKYEEAAREPVLIPEEKAAELAMKKAKEAARKAYYAGKRVGIKTERVRKAGLIKAQREKKKLRAYINKLAAQIARRPGKSVDFFYREAIENLQAGIDPHFRRRDTLESRERTRRFIEQRPEAKEMIPKKVLKILEKRSLNEMTIAELETLRNEVDILRHIGRTKRQLEIVQRNRSFEDRRDTLTQTVLRGEKLTEETRPVVKATAEAGKVKKGLRFARVFPLRPMRIFDKLDGGKQFKGDWHRIFYNEVNEKENQKLRTVDSRLDSGKAKRKELGIRLGDLARNKTEVDGVKYTLDEALDIYAGMKNESKSLAIVYGNNIDPKTAQKIIDSLTDEEKALADRIIADYEEHYEDLRNAHIEFTDEDLGHEENYTPMRRTDVSYETMNEELRDELLRKTHLKKGYAEKGFTISRQEIPSEFQKPIRLGLYSTWIGQVPKQEHYIAYAQKVRDLHRLLNDKQLSTAVKQKYGDEYYTAIRHYVDRVANPTIYKQFDKLDRISQTLRKNFALAHLAYNLVTMAKQLPSVILYLPEAGPGHLVASMAEFVVRPFKTIEFVNSKDPQMKHRSIEREMEELKRLDSGLYNRILKKVGKTGMIGIYAMDKVATTIGWKAVYEANLKKGLSEAEAVQEAQNVTLRTQPAAHAKDVAELYASREILNWFTQFTNQLNQLYNIATYDIPQTFKQHKFYKGMLQLTAMSITALSIWAISNRRLPEKIEDVKDAVKDQVINMIPLIGKPIAAKDRGYGADAPAPLDALSDLATLYKSAAWVKKSPGDWFTDRRFQKAANKALEAIAVLIGLPYTGPKRVKKAIEEKDIKELIGGEPRR